MARIKAYHNGAFKAKHIIVQNRYLLLNIQLVLTVNATCGKSQEQCFGTKRPCCKGFDCIIEHGRQFCAPHCGKLHEPCAGTKQPCCEGCIQLKVADLDTQIMGTDKIRQNQTKSDKMAYAKIRHNSILSDFVCSVWDCENVKLTLCMLSVQSMSGVSETSKMKDCEILDIWYHY
uniref:Uncharacterized protein n=1 Tax=Strigamia maritima TaxID=126957 RepID=T1INQ5_STRMM